MSIDAVRKYEAALALERDRSCEVTLAEYRIVMEATTLCMLYPSDPHLAVLKAAVQRREEALKLLTDQMAKVVEASKAARIDFAEEVTNDLH